MARPCRALGRGGLGALDQEVGKLAEQSWSGGRGEAKAEGGATQGCSLWQGGGEPGGRAERKQEEGDIQEGLPASPRETRGQISQPEG